MHLLGGSERGNALLERLELLGSSFTFDLTEDELSLEGPRSGSGKVGLDGLGDEVAVVLETGSNLLGGESGPEVLEDDSVRAGGEDRRVSELAL